MSSGFSTEMSNDSGSTQVYTSQSLPLIPIILNSSHTRGIQVDRRAVVEAIGTTRIGK